MPGIPSDLLGLAASPWLALTALFFAPFVREDVAIVLGGLMIVEHDVPGWKVLASLYAGIVTSDLLLFGLGRLAVRSARVRRFLSVPKIERIGGWLLHNLPAAMIVARVVPGMITPVYIGAGLVGARFWSFAPMTLLTAAVYLATLLWIVVRFGEGVLSGMGYWGWILAIVLLVAILSHWTRHPPWGLLFRGTAFIGGKGQPTRPTEAAAESGPSHAGLPSLRDVVRHIGAAELIPPKVFYAPLGLHWLWLSIRYRSLSLPALVNPLIEVGGLWGESKQVYLDMVTGDARRWLARYLTLSPGPGGAAEDTRRALALATDAGLSFPMVAKPDIGWQGYGVRPIESAEALERYIGEFPTDATMMLQEMVPWEAEAGVFYVRMPGDEAGKVVALTLRYFPHVVGDGVHTVRDLILADERASWKARLHLGLGGGHAGVGSAMLGRIPEAGETVRLSFIGSIRVGGLYRDASGDITPDLSARFDAISRSMPEFFYGRFDIRFASMERLRAGEDFRIIEINGAGSESISAWDPQVPVSEVYRRLASHQRMLFEIGARNRARGWKAPGLTAVLRAAWKQRRLIGRYPPST